MSWRNIRLIFNREVLDQLRDRRTIFMVVVLPLLLYPSLGIGTLQMSLLFSEQPRTVVILGADSLPDPAFLNPEGTAIQDRWFPNLGDAQKLHLITDKSAGETSSASSEDSEDSPAENSTENSQGDPAVKTSIEQEEELATLQLASEIRIRLQEMKRLSKEKQEALEQKDEKVVQLKQDQINTLREQVSLLFSSGNIQVLIIFPEGFDEYINNENERLASRENEIPPPQERLRPTIIRNSAIEKSAIAYGRVREAFDNWENELLSRRLALANLPSDLTSPVNVDKLDLAQGSELAANVWSKLFPAMLVLMAMTGAFYPAVDLGAGEKERGTMETLLICPALRSEIVIGKFLTVLLFSLVTAILNITMMGVTGLHMLNTATGGQLSQMGDFALPGIDALIWVGLLAIPLAALFSALSLAFALFAKSSKEGQYYLTPLLTVTMGLTVFCLSPAVEITPFYSLVPVMGPALLLKGVLLGGAGPEGITWFIAPVLVSSFLYCALALSWAIDQFQREDVLFSQSERFDLRLWIRHLFRDKEQTPNFTEAIFCFVMIMFLQFAMLKTFGTELQNAPQDQQGITMLRLLVVQQLVIIACPALFMGILLTSNPLKTFQLKMPSLKFLLLGLSLPLVLHPLSLELQMRLAWFFPALPEHAQAALSAMGDSDIPWPLVILAFAVAPAICEEIAFRGFILSGFRNKGRDGLAIIFSGILFGIMHMIPQQAFNAALLGLVIGLLAVRSGSIIPCILFHFMNNTLGVLHGHFGKMRETSGIMKQLTIESEAGIHYPLWLIAVAFVIACLLIRLLWIKNEAESHPE